MTQNHVKNILRFLILLISLAVISCGPKKDMIYMDKDINYNAEITQARFQGNKLMIGDVLDIKVTGYDEIAIKPFNLNTISQINNAEVGNTSSSANLNYTVLCFIWNIQQELISLLHIFLKLLNVSSRQNV